MFIRTLFIVSLVAFSLSANAAKHIKTSVVIDAPVSIVWQQLMNFAAYPDWNPFVVSIKGSSEIGEKLAVTILPPNKEAMDFAPKVLAVKPEQEFRWLGQLMIPWLFDGEHYFLLKAINAQQTEFIHGEKFSGMLVPLVWGSMEENTRQGFEQMNQALKQVAEQQYLDAIQ